MISLIHILNKTLKRKISKRKTLKKKDIGKKDTEKINTKKNSIEHDANNNKLTTSADIKVHIIDKQKLIKQRYIRK